MMETKKCTKCGEDKALTEFKKNRSKKHGVDSQCKSCTSAAAAVCRKIHAEAIAKQKKDWYLKNKEKVLKKARDYQAKNPEKARQRAKQWASENKERVRSKRREYALRHPERIRKSMADWEARNIEKVRINAIKKQQKSISCLSNSYVAITLHLPVSECTQELIELKRLQLTIHRFSKQMKKEIQNV